MAGFRFLALGLSFFTHVLLARSLGPQGFGVYAFTIALLTIIQPIAGGGLGALATRELARIQYQKDANELKRGIIRDFLCIGALISTCVGFIVTVIGCIATSEKFSTLNLAIIILPTFVIVETMTGVLVGQSKVKTSQFISEVLKPLFFLFGLLSIFSIFDLEISSTNALMMIALASLLAVVVAIYLSPTRPGSTINFKDSYPTWLAVLRRSFPFAMITAMQYFNTRIDIIFIGNFMTTVDVGVYQVATKIAGFVHMPASLVAILLAPRFSAAFAEDGQQRLRRLFVLGQIAAIVLGASICLAFVLVGNNMIIWIYGADYLSAVPPLFVLSIVQLVFSTTAVTTVLLSMTAFEGKVMQALMVGVIGNIILNTILIPQYGIVGAASATSAMWLVTFVILGISLYRSGVLFRRTQK